MAKALNFKQELTAAFGDPIAENPTQVMIEAAYRHHGLDWRYLNCRGQTGRPLGRRRAVPGRWASRASTARSPTRSRSSSTSTGSANRRRSWARSTAWCAAASQLIGENTDGKGFVQSLQGRDRSARQEGGHVRRRRRGTGHRRRVGAGRRRVDHDRQPRAERPRHWSRLLNEKTPRKADARRLEGDYHVPDGTDIVVNATSIGLYPDVDGAARPRPRHARSRT